MKDPAYEAFAKLPHDNDDQLKMNDDGTHDVEHLAFRALHELDMHNEDENPIPRRDYNKLVKFIRDWYPEYLKEINN